MRPYEIMFILDPNLDSEKSDALVARFTQIITDGGGTVEKVDRWGKRRLAYEIAGHLEGDYTVLQFQGDAAITGELDRVMKLSEDVIRHLLVRRDEEGE